MGMESAKFLRGYVYFQSTVSPRNVDPERLTVTLYSSSRAFLRCLKSAGSVYLMPKLSKTRANVMELELWRQRDGVYGTGRSRGELGV